MRWVITVFLISTLLTCQLVHAKNKPQNKYAAGAYKIAWHYAFTKKLDEFCPNIKTNGNLGHLGPFPNHYSEMDKRFDAMSKARNQGEADGSAFRETFIKKNSGDAYCIRLVSDYGAGGQVTKNYIIEKSIEEKAGLRDTSLSGCKTIDDTRFYNWACDLDPRAYPEICKEKKQKLLKNSICRAGMRVLRDQLKRTGKTHDQVWHREFTGLKSSGPFVQITEQSGALFWVDKFDWEYATEMKK